MSYETPEEPIDNDNWQSGEYEGDTGLPFGEHDPTVGILSDVVFSTDVDGFEQETPTFGIQQFERIEPQFEGHPPQEYIDATTTPFDKLVNHNDGHQAKYNCLFLDRDDAPITDITTLYGATMVTHTDMEYISPNGRAEIRLDHHRADVRFLDNDGQTVSYAGYYMSPQVRDGEGFGKYYAVIHKDTTDPMARATVDTTGMEESDALILQADAEREYLKRRADNADPLVSVEEADYVFGEVLANARYVPKTHADVMAAIEYQRVNPPTPDAGAENIRLDESIIIYNGLIDAYQKVVSTPEEAATWNHETHREHITPDGNKAEHITGIIPKNRMTGPETTYIIIAHAEILDDNALAERITQKGIRDVPVPAVAGGSFNTEIRIKGTGKEVTAEYHRSLTIGDVGTWRWSPLSFVPTKQVMRTIRNYLQDDLGGPVSEYS